MSTGSELVEGTSSELPSQLKNNLFLIREKKERMTPLPNQIKNKVSVLSPRCIVLTIQIWTFFAYSKHMQFEQLLERGLFGIKMWFSCI